MDVCEFDKLFAKSVPHVVEKIFLCLDFRSFQNCLEVSTSWKDILSSNSFLKKGKSVFSTNEMYHILVQAAVEYIQKGNADEVRRIFSSGMVDENFVIKRNAKYELEHNVETPLFRALYLAADRGLKDVVRLLLDGGADPDRNGAMSRRRRYFVPDGFPNSNPYTNPHGWTAVHLAAMCGHQEYIERAIAEGVELDAPDKHGWTPLYYAFQENHTSIVDILRDKLTEYGII